MSTFWCTSCRATVQLVVDHFHHQQYEYSSRPDRHFEFGHCILCEAPGILELEEVGQNQYAMDRQVYPPLDDGISYPLPPKVQESYQEARTCSKAGANIATAVMVRRTLEAITREFSAEKTLAAGLKAMHAQGVISNELAEWGDELRFLGNVGAHPTDVQVAPTDAEEAMEFLEAIVETLYHLRPKFQARKQRRMAAKGTAAAQVP